MPLVKVESVTIIPGSPGVAGQEGSTYCVTPPPGEGEGSIPPTPPPLVPPPTDSGGQETDIRVYLYDVNGENRTPSFLPAPPGYLCETGSFFLPDPTFPGGQIPVFETRCYQQP